MKYVKSCLIITMLLGIGYSQCDANGDGELNVLDVVIEVECILNDCWEEEPSICDGLTEVELWGEYYDIETTTEIDLYNQELTGSIPPEIGCLTNLTYLRLSYNQLTGEIPSSIGNLTNLTSLQLHSNELTGEIPSSIGNLTNLTSLYLHDNQLSGEIPPEIGNLTNLVFLNLGGNQLTGEIPPEIGNLTNLTTLALHYNQLTGEIPQAVCDLIESNNLNINSILSGNNLINTCEETTDVCEDIDGNVYETIQIGDQLWMAENLKVTHYRDGSEIQYVQSESSEPDIWENLSTGAYGYYNDDPSHLDTYGNLYNWYTVDDVRGVCPEGFHVPSDDEWTDLITYLDVDADPDALEQSDIAGGMLKDTGTIQDGDGLWNYYSDEITEEATNESGFTGLPAGFRSYSNGSTYYYRGNNGSFWSSSETSSSSAWTRELHKSYSSVIRWSLSKRYGFSIRCLGD